MRGHEAKPLVKQMSSAPPSIGTELNQLTAFLPGLRDGMAQHGFANASAAKPVLRKTAESALEQFMERLQRVNASSEYVYCVESAVLFGSMLSEAERLGDVDIAIELLPKVVEEAEFCQWCDRRRYAARDQGRRFGSTVDWVLWPKEEIFEVLRARARTLSLHGIHDLAELTDVRYRVLWGNPGRIAGLIRSGRPC